MRVLLVLETLVLALAFSWFAPVVVPALQPAPATADAAALDLPAMVLMPADLPWPSYGRYGGVFGGAADRAHGDPALAADLVAAGFVRSYLGMLARPSEDAPAIAGAMIWSVVTRFSTGAGAATGFAALADPRNLPARGALLADPPTVGAEAVWWSARTVETDGTSLRAVALLTRVDDLLAEVWLVNRGLDEPDLADVEIAARALLARVEAVRAGGAPELSERVLRLAGDEVVTFDDGYVRLDGERIPVYGGASGVVDDPWRAGATDLYGVQQWLAPDDELWPILGGRPRPFFYADARRYPTADAAADALGHTADDIRPRVDGLDEMTSTPVTVAGADEALAVAYSLTTLEARRHVLVVVLRVGSVAGVLLFSGEQPLAVDDVRGLAETEVACLLGKPCAPVPLPPGLVEAMTTPADPHLASRFAIPDTPATWRDAGDRR